MVKIMEVAVIKVEEVVTIKVNKGIYPPMKNIF
jgi:hypothetical protein